MERPSASRPGPHPDPPSALHDLPLPLRSVHGPWFRSFACERDPIYFGRSRRFRFDAPDGEYGVLYAGIDPHCAFVETFGESRRPDGLISVALAALERRCLAQIITTRSVALVDFTGSSLAQIGADARLCTGDYRVAQRWSAALWAHPSQPDGIYYRARHDPERYCIALFDRARDVIGAMAASRFTDHANHVLLGDIVETYTVKISS